MSGVLGSVFSVASSPIMGIGMQALSATGLLPAFIRQKRTIGTIIPDVTIEEDFSDRMTVTQHPVAKGTPVSDHAYMMPKTVTMKCGWSNANLVGAVTQGVQGLFSGGSLSDSMSGVVGSFTESRAKDIYDKLLALQATRQPFTLTTGKRTYKDNMVITELSATNDYKTEYALIISVQMQEVILVDVGSANNPNSDQENQTKPETTQQTSDGGNVQPDPKPQSSILPSIFPGLKLGDYNPVKP